MLDLIKIILDKWILKIFFYTKPTTSFSKIMSARGNRKSGEVFPMVRVSDCHTSKKGYPHLSADHHSGRSGSIQVKKLPATNYFNPYVYVFVLLNLETECSWSYVL